MSLKPTVKIDTREFRRALRQYKRATDKEWPDVLNHTATQAAFKAMTARYTPAANKTGQLSSTADPKRKRAKWRYRDRFYFALAQKRGTPGLAEASKIYARRRSSVGYVRANYGNVVNKLGKRRARNSVRNPKILVSKARISKLVAYFANDALDGPGAHKSISKIAPGLVRAMRDAVFGRGGMLEFAQGRLKKHSRRISV
jgi:hypothetical protein